MPCAFTASESATLGPTAPVTCLQNKKKMPRGYKQHPNYTNSSLPQTRVHSGSRARHKCVCWFSGLTCRNRLLLFIYAYKDESLFSEHLRQASFCSNLGAEY